jgi:hypothetical protein
MFRRNLSPPKHWLTFNWQHRYIPEERLFNVGTASKHTAPYSGHDMPALVSELRNISAQLCILRNLAQKAVSFLRSSKLFGQSEDSLSVWKPTIHYAFTTACQWTLIREEGLSRRSLILLICKGKVVLVLIYLSTMPWRHMGEWRYSSTLLGLGTRYRSVVTFTTPATLLPRYPFDRKLGGPQSGSWRFREKKKKMLLWGKLKPGSPARSPSLYRLRYT